MFNYITRNPYSGENVTMLLESMEENGFASEYFLTFLQAKKCGRTVKKGSTGTQIMKVVTKEILDRETGEKKKIKVPKRYTVFNLEQTEELESEG